MLVPFLAALLALAGAVQADTLVKAKLHAWRSPGLCVALGDGTAARDIVLRPCEHPQTTLVLRDADGPTFLRHRNYCLNGGFMHLDGGLDSGNGRPAHGQYCQFEANRDQWDLFNGIMFPWRWFRRGERFFLYGLQDFVDGPCLDVKDGQLWSGAKLQLWACHPAGHRDYDNQRFNIEFLGPEYP